MSAALPGSRKCPPVSTACAILLGFSPVAGLHQTKSSPCDSLATRAMAVKQSSHRILYSSPRTLEPGDQSSPSSRMKQQFHFPFFINSSFSRDVLATFCSRSTFIISFFSSSHFLLYSFPSPSANLKGNCMVFSIISQSVYSALAQMRTVSHTLSCSVSPPYTLLLSPNLYFMPPRELTTLPEVYIFQKLGLS